MDQKQKGLVGLGAMAVLAAATVLGSEPLYKAIDNIGKVPASYTPGTYSAVAQGFGGDVIASVTVSDQEITLVDLQGAGETPGIGSLALEQLPAAIIEKQSSQVDAVTGATITSDAVVAAVTDALAQASGQKEVTVLETTAAEETEAETEEETTTAAETEAVAEELPAGTYRAKAKGMMGDVEVEVVMNGTEIISVTVLSHDETAGLSDPAIEQIPAAVVAAQSADVDAVSGATVTSEAIMTAVAQCLEQAADGTEQAEAGGSGTYTAQAKGMMGDVKVEVVIADGKIESVSVVSHDETAGLSDPAIELVPQAIVEAQGTDVDTVSGATVTSEAIIKAVDECLAQAGLSE